MLSGYGDGTLKIPTPGARDVRPDPGTFHTFEDGFRRPLYPAFVLVIPVPGETEPFVDDIEA